MPSKNHTGSGGHVYENCGRYGYTFHNSEGMWIDPKILIRELPDHIHFKSLLELIKTQSRDRLDKLIQDHLDKNLINEGEYFYLIDQLPAKR